MKRLAIADIEARRVALRVTVVALTRVAGVHEATYRRIRKGKHKPSPDTLAALDLALKRLARQPDCDPSERSRHVGVVVRALAALTEQLASAHAKLADPADRRRTVMGLANSGLGISAAHLASAEGVTRAAMHYRLRAHEDAREDPAFDALMDRIEQQLRGG